MGSLREGSSRLGRQGIGPLRITVVIALLIGLVVGVSACGDDEGSDASGGGGTASFGLMSPLSAQFAFLGEAYEAGANLAVEEINEAGGTAGGEDVELKSIDTEGKPSGAVTALSQLVDVDNVDGLIGPSSLEVTAVQNRIKESGVPNVGLAPSTAVDGQWGGTMWRILPSDALLGPVLAQAAIDQGYTEAGFLAEKAEGSQSVKRNVDSAYGPLGGTLGRQVDVAPEQANYSAELAQLLEAPAPSALFYDVSPESAATMWGDAAQFSDQLKGMVLLGSDAIVAEESIEALGSALDLVDLYYIAPQEKGPAKGQYTAAWKKANGTPTPAEFSSYAYDAAILLALAMEAAGSTDHAAVSDQMLQIATAPGEKCTSYKQCKGLLEDGKEIDYQGASGDLEIGEDGEVFGSFAFDHFENGKSTEVAHYDQEQIQQIVAKANAG